MDTYVALRIISGLLRVVGWLLLAIGVFVILFALVVPHGPFAPLLFLVGAGLTAYQLAGGISLLIFGLILVGFGEAMKALAAIAINIDQIAMNTERTTTREMRASDGHAASFPPQPQRVPAPRSMPAPKGSAARSGERVKEAHPAREEFRNVETELTNQSIAILRLAKEEGYEISLGGDKTVVVERGSADAIYFVSNYEIEEWGKAQGWL